MFPVKRSWGSPWGSFFVAGTGMGSYSPTENSPLLSLLKDHTNAVRPYNKKHRLYLLYCRSVVLFLFPELMIRRERYG
jgi:hypothetical protein